MNKDTAPSTSTSSAGSTTTTTHHHKKTITSKINTGRSSVVSRDFNSLPRRISKLTTQEEDNTNKSSTLEKKKPPLKKFPNAPSRKDPRIREFVRANARVPNISTLFHEEVDPQNLSNHLVRNARKSGQLNLSGRNLISVPMKVWRINELDESEKSNVSLSMDDGGDSADKWWEFVELQKLIVANNYVKDVPCDISNLRSLQTFDAHDNQIQTISKDIGKLEQLSKLDLSYNKLYLLPEELGGLKRLMDLNLSHNLLEEVPTSFGELSCLKALDLSHNNLLTFPGDLGFLSFLQTLSLSNNKLTGLPEDIGGLTALRTLNISENCLKTLPKSISDLLHLEILYAQKNKISEIPDFTKIRTLKELHLQNNQVRVINSEKFINTKISLLDLRMNKVDTLDIDPEELEFLERFYLDNNNIGELPEELSLLPSLKALTLDGNPIRGIRIDILQRGTVEILKYLRGRLRLSEESSTEQNEGSSPALVISPPRRKSRSPSNSRLRLGGSNVEDLGLDKYKLKNSKSLVLSSRQIKNLEEDVFQLAEESGVTIIDLSKNILTILSPSIDLCSEWLMELKLDFNKLTYLPSCLGKCSRLQFLSVQNNAVEELPDEFRHLKGLREVNLGFNRLLTFPPCLYDIPTLEIVNLDSNKLTQLDPDNLRKLRRLAVLDVRNNSISVLPAELGLLTQLKCLSVEGNAFRVPNYQVISKGTDAIMGYLRNRLKD